MDEPDTPFIVAYKTGFLSVGPEEGTVLEILARQLRAGDRVRDVPMLVRWPSGDEVLVRLEELRVVRGGPEKVRRLLNSRLVRRVKLNAEKLVIMRNMLDALDKEGAVAEFAEALGQAEARDILSNRSGGTSSGFVVGLVLGMLVGTFMGWQILQYLSHYFGG